MEIALDANVLLNAIWDLANVAPKPRNLPLSPRELSELAIEVGATARSTLLLCSRNRCLVPREVNEEVRYALMKRLGYLEGWGSRLERVLEREMSIVDRVVHVEDIRRYPEFDKCERIVRETVWNLKRSRKLFEKGDLSLMILACIKKMRGEDLTIVTGDNELANAIWEILLNVEGNGNVEVVNVSPTPANKLFSENVSRILDWASEVASELTPF